MCRLLAYRGEPILLSELICAGRHSLVRQSQFAQESATCTNGDGIGVGWYGGDRGEPALYREANPAWLDENLRALCHLVKSRLFFAHIRASTGTPVNRMNCHPFVRGNWLFMHNGQVGGYAAIRDGIEAMIPDRLWGSRMGSSDSEALFLSSWANGVGEDPVGAVVRTLRLVHSLMEAAGISEPLRFTAALSDGETVFGFRWASDNQPPTLYYRESSGRVILASEPLDGCRKNWHEVPKGCTLVALPGRAIRLERLKVVD